MTPEEIQNELTVINSLSHEAMAKLVRFAPAGHKYFSHNNLELNKAFKERFQKFGGMTPAISKSIGFGRG